MSNYPRGSEWRRWDLHFHTPSSHDVSDSITNEQIVAAWKANNISVVAVTDHHEIDIQRISDLRRLAEPENITIFPGIEFLSDARGSEPIHFIGIFAEDSNIEHIWGQLSNKTRICDIKGKGSKHNEVYCDLIDTINIIKNDLGGIVSIHAGKKSNSLENITHSLPHGDAQKRDIAEIIDIFEMGKEKDLADYKKIVFPSIGQIIPMIMCSDNHDINNYSFKAKLWIKTDPTFEGLKQAINEPEDRIFIGEEPEVLARVKHDKTRYIKSLSISTCDGKASSDQVWYKDLNIPISKELTAIIGNKGSGKSAIADIIGLCSDARHQEDFQFLHKSKFKKRGFAERFFASVKFESNIETDARTLDYSIRETDAPKIRYLPQNYYEKVCNEIEKSESFRAEIEDVVFQYVNNEERLNTNSFSDLVLLKKSGVDEEILSIKNKISSLNKEIIILENKTNPAYKDSIESKLKSKNDELTAHNTNLPQSPQNVEEDVNAASEKEAATQQILLELSTKLDEISDSTSKLNTELTENNLSIQQLSQLNREIITYKKTFDEFINKKKDVFKKFGFNPLDIISLSVDVSKIDVAVKEIEQRNCVIKELLGDDIAPFDINAPEIPVDGKPLPLKDQKKKIENELNAIKNNLSQAEQAHQKHLTEVKLWEEKKNSLLGSSLIPESIEGYKHEIEYVEKHLTTILTKKRAKRTELCLDVYSKKSEIKKFYDEIKSAIISQLSSCDGQNLTIVSSLNLASDFSEIFLSHILQNKSGSFYGSDDGKKYLNESILKTIEWNDIDSILVFLSSIMEAFEKDKRTKFLGESRFIGEQIKNRERLYDYLFSLDYLNPVYELQKDGKNIEALSPGEKGALLLVFYLVLDKSTIPLVIDQPEDNLDNNSVYKILVPFIREAKKRRQIIMVTHNPNLAVVADAEQVIRASIDKENGNKFSYISGSIENPTINKAIVDVLEGTMPAFNTRKKKYLK